MFSDASLLRIVVTSPKRSADTLLSVSSFNPLDQSGSNKRLVAVPLVRLCGHAGGRMCHIEHGLLIHH